MAVQSPALESDCLWVQVLSPTLWLTIWHWDNWVWLSLWGPSLGSWHVVSDQQMRAVIILFVRLPLTFSTAWRILFNPITPWRILLSFLPFQRQVLKLRVVMSFVQGFVAAEVWQDLNTGLMPNDWHRYLALLWCMLFILVFSYPSF